jgi:hypothetical protein
MNNRQKIARRMKAKHLIYTSTIGRTTWPTGVIKIESSCAVGGSNCILSERDCALVSCSARNEKAVVKKHKKLRLEGLMQEEEQRKSRRRMDIWSNCTAEQGNR